MDETAAACTYICPDNHYLESWNDANPVSGHFSLGQPTISALFDTRQTQESLMKWSGIEGSYYDYIKAYWEANVFPKSGALMFMDFWNHSLHDGVVETKLEETEDSATAFAGDINQAAAKVAGMKPSASGYELTLYIKEGVGHGVGADNPVLQELPDPVSKITWDNYVTMNPSEMEEKGYNTILGQESPANILTVSAAGQTIELPVIAQPGQARGTVGIALGYGKAVGKMKELTGKNAYPLVAVSKDGVVAYTADATIADVEGSYPIAAAQTQQTVMGRDSIVRETTLDVYKKGDRADFNPVWTLLSGETDDHGHQVAKPLKEFDLWGDQPVKNIGHRWGMSIDMNLCTGCGACVTACNIENNVAVIGKDEVRRGRIMHWLRIDRYYSSDHQPLGDVGGTLNATMEAEDKGVISSYTSMESPADNPSVVHQPMMCQHCNHAGCETVCPVAATTHSNEGLNMMAYNRCIGTRYCANNCAYKVRRFNWYNYIANSKFEDINPSQDDLGRMVLNPDVVVRSRGVMEKCSFCIQGIQAAKLEAKKEGRPVRDGDVDCACSTACGSGAIIFGDLNDKKSEVRAGMEKDRAYRVIEEVGQDANVYYQTKVRNLKAKA
jgi:molybdopterin-containing oxidoreductase family iron-sulfur binding subunit